MKTNLQVRWAFILVGNNNSGKTTFQKILRRKLSGEEIDERLSPGVVNVDARIFSHIENVFLSNRSVQEWIISGSITKVEDFFPEKMGIEEPDLVIASSHLNSNKGCLSSDIQILINGFRKRRYNVGLLLFNNTTGQTDVCIPQIFALDWDKRIIVNNPPVDSQAISRQIELLVDEFWAMVNRNPYL